MKSKQILWLLPLMALLGLGAVLVTPGKKISEYPNVGTTAPDSALLLLAITNVAVPTNNNMVLLDFLRQGTNGLATTGFVNTVGTTVSNGAVTFTLTASNALFNLSQSAGSNLVVVLSGANTTVSMTSTNGTNFYTVNSTASGGGGGGGFVSGITNIAYSTTNVIVDLGQTNYAVWNITNTAGPVNLLFTNLTVGFNFTVLIDGENVDGGTTASNMGVTYVWPAPNSVTAHWLGWQTNDWVTSNKVLGISGLIRKTNDVIISSRE